MIGQVVDEKYEIVQQIGSGGMGAVYEAIRLESDERVALKVISVEEAGLDDVALKRFKREAVAAGKLESPFIVGFVDAGHDESSGDSYLAMERLDGEDLAHALKRIGALPPGLAMRIGIQACFGLAEAHDAGVVHRDIKPANLFLAKGEEEGELVLKLLDFGVAKFKMDEAARTDNKSLTRTGNLLGSPMYMSPEQARGLKSIDHRADLWSLGVVLYQLLTGQPPFRGVQGLGELIITICSEEPRPLIEAAPWVSDEMAQAVHGALKLAPEERYESAEAMGEALQEALTLDWQIKEEMVTGVTREQRMLGLKRRKEGATSRRGGPKSSTRGAKKDDAPPSSEEEAAESAPPSSMPDSDEPDSDDDLDSTRDSEAPAAASSSSPLRIAGAVAVGAALGLAGIMVLSGGDDTTPAPPPPPAPVSSAVIIPPSAAVSAGNKVLPPEPEPTPTVRIPVLASSAVVTVDGLPVEVKDGAIHLPREVGKTHSIILRVGEEATTVKLEMTEAGPTPSALGEAPPAPSASVSASASASAAPLAPPIPTLPTPMPGSPVPAAPVPAAPKPAPVAPKPAPVAPKPAPPRPAPPPANDDIY